eukprot:comp22255_c1_seq1/m.32879 comp22255_c1_seq1/g.32879  ORF comp22255_c1_seq1/g.32879 comp22255_c1_seq1/m.32879 type:complete len:438 (-) comp22255_c1_seq1:367-1680(-)
MGRTNICRELLLVAAVASAVHAQGLGGLELASIPCAGNLPPSLLKYSEYNRCVETHSTDPNGATAACQDQLLSLMVSLSDAVSDNACRTDFVHFINTTIVAVDVGCFLDIFSSAKRCQTAGNSSTTCVSEAKTQYVSCTQRVLTEMTAGMGDTEAALMLSAGSTWNNLTGCLSHAPTLKDTVGKEQWEKIEDDIEDVCEAVEDAANAQLRTVDPLARSLLLAMLKGKTDLMGGDKDDDDDDDRRKRDDSVKYIKFSEEKFLDLTKCRVEWEAFTGAMAEFLNHKDALGGFQQVLSRMLFLGGSMGLVQSVLSANVLPLLSAVDCLFTWQGQEALHTCKKGIEPAVEAFVAGISVTPSPGVNPTEVETDSWSKATVLVASISLGILGGTALLGGTVYAIWWWRRRKGRQHSFLRLPEGTNTEMADLNFEDDLEDDLNL